MPYGATQQGVSMETHMHNHDNLLMGPGAQANQMGLPGSAGPPPPSYHLTPEQQQAQHYAANGGANGNSTATPTPDSQYYSSYCDTRGKCTTGPQGTFPSILYHLVTCATCLEVSCCVNYELPMCAHNAAICVFQFNQPPPFLSSISQQIS